MPFFRSKAPEPGEVRSFGRGRQTSAKAAEAYAQQKRDKAATRASQSERRAADRRAGRR